MSRIFVSSTFVDLREHRAALSRTIRRLGHVDVAMEYFVAEDSRPVDRCLRDAASCDLYVGIFARRYGFVPDGGERSVTELELRTARAAGIDCLCFLLADDAPWPPEHEEQGEGATRLAALRAEIGADYLCGFFTTPHELAAVASAAIVRNLELDDSPFDAAREHRLMKSWRSATALPLERVRAAQALVNMGSPRYAAAIKERLVDAGSHHDVAEMAHSLDQLQRLASSRRELMPIFLDLLEHEDAGRRSFAVFQLGELALRGASLAPSVVDALLERARDDDPMVRAELAHTLGKLTSGDGARGAVRATLQALALDEAAEVRTRAGESLAWLGVVRPAAPDVDGAS